MEKICFFACIVFLKLYIWLNSIVNYNFDSSDEYQNFQNNPFFNNLIIKLFKFIYASKFCTIPKENEIKIFFIDHFVFRKIKISLKKLVIVLFNYIICQL